MRAPVRGSVNYHELRKAIDRLNDGWRLRVTNHDDYCMIRREDVDVGVEVDAGFAVRAWGVNINDRSARRLIHAIWAELDRQQEALRPTPGTTALLRSAIQEVARRKAGEGKTE